MAAVDCPGSKPVDPARTYVPLMVVLVAVCTGIVADRYLRFALGLWAGFSIGSLVGWLFCWAWRRDWLASGMLLLAVAGAGGAWHHLWWRIYNRWEIARYVIAVKEELAGSVQPGELTEAIFQPEISESGSGIISEPDCQALWSKAVPVALEGVVQSVPYAVPLASISRWQREQDLHWFRFQTAVTRIRDQRHWRPVSGRVVVWVGARRLEELTGRFGLGDRVRIFGQLARIAPPANPGQYDFAESMRSYRILCSVRCFGPECIELLTPAAWYRPDRLLEAFRRHCAERFQWYVSESLKDSDFSDQWLAETGGADGSERVVFSLPRQQLSATGQLAATILLGLREELPPDYTEPFVRTGTVHLLAISGLHVGMVVLMVSWLMRLVGASRTIEILAIACGCLMYMFLSGARPPTVRATVLVELACLAALAGRQPLNWNTLAAAGLVILAINPTELFRLGTQLSFLSVGGLFLLGSKYRLGEHLLPKMSPQAQSAPTVWWERIEKLFVPHRPLAKDWASSWQLLRRWKQYVWTWLGPLDSSDPLDRLILRSMSRTERAVRWLIHTFGFILASGAVIWGVVTPLIMARMHLCPLSGLLLNALAWIPMMAAMVSGFLFLALGWVWEPLAQLLAGSCSLSLYSLKTLIDWAAHLPGSYFWTPGPAGWWLLGFYGGLAAWLIWFRSGFRLRWAVVVLVSWIALGLGASTVLGAFRAKERGQWECTFLSVGHGLAVVLHLPDGQTWLYDAGATAPAGRTAEIIAGYLWSRGIRQLEAVFLSHPDQDHYNALPELLERFRIERVIMPAGMLRQIGQLRKKYEKSLEPRSLPASIGSPNRFVESAAGSIPPELELYLAICRKNTQIYIIHAPWQWQPEADTTCWVFHPPVEGIPGNDNANSLVLAIQAYGRRLLLTGDLEPPGMQRLLAQSPWDCDLLLAPHHGSRKSMPEQLARWCQPEWVVISGGRVLSTPLTEHIYRSAGARVYHTARHGAVFAKLDRHQLHLQTHW
ncbi:MAG: ComEC/Rec2 family competence protein [Thermoguttaceae bacterium]|nr:ComEC/Rec2 family competence protein [Thermoguttaceae bacterium]MDW8039404.1 ComEC/Rec2 family competence protein [Thermoguttaceae bacterium]